MKSTSAASYQSRPDGAYLSSWAAYLVSQLTAAGWVQTSDTGQTASASLAGTSTANAVSGYQIWRMNDSLQATAPVFIKLEFGCGVTSCVGLWLTIGTATNGAGTLTGQTSPRFSLSPSANNTTTNYPIVCSGDAASFRACLWYGAAATATVIFSIERSKDATNADTAEGVIFQGLAATNSQYFLPCSGGGNYSVVPTLTYFTPTGLTSLTVGNDTTFLPLIPYNYDSVRNSGLSLLVYLTADFPDNLQTTVAINGANHVYWTSGQVITGTYKLAMRYE